VPASVPRARCLRRSRRLWLRVALWVRGAARHGGAILGICGIVVLWSGVLYSLSVERQQALRGAAENTTNLSRAFEEHIVRSVKAVDQTLLYARDSYVRDPAGFDISAWAKNTQFLTDLAFQISLIDKSGIMIGSNLASAGNRIDLSDREHFRVHVDNPRDELFISKPVLGRASKKWSIQMTRKIIAADGSFGGVVVVSLDPQYLSRFYDSVDLGKKGVVTLAGTDGIIRARAAGDDTSIGQSMAGSRLFAEYARAKSGTYETVSVVDGVLRIHAYRAVRSYPLIVTVGIAEDEVLADYNANRRSYAILASVLTLLLLMVTVMIVRHQAGLQRTRRELRASEARYAQKSKLLEAALENMSQGIMMVDADNRVQVCNHHAMEKLGLPEELMAAHPLFDDLLRWQWHQGEFGKDGGDVETWLRDFVLAGGISDKVQTYERTRPNGRVIEFRSTPLEGGGMVRTYTDITQRKETESVLRAARDGADRAARAKSEFLAMMSHEIRSPMNGLLGIIELLRDTKLEADQMHMVELVHESAASLLGILNDVLDFSKIEVGAVSMVPEPTAIHDLVRVLMEPVALAAARKGLQLQCRLAGDVPDWISVDPLRLRQILGNLVSNSIKFTAAGTVELAVSRATLPAGAAALAFAVSDTGIGMSPETVHRLFEPFSQADTSTTKHFGGTGLGLSISRRLARMLGGDIEAASAKGSGSVFTLTIPLVIAAPDDAARDSDTTSFDPDELQGVRVLVAEDQETNRWLVKRQFARFGIEVEIVEDGHQALAALAAGKFDLLVTDCHMPVMDGIELAQCIRAAEAKDCGARLPILGLTADATAAMRERCLAAGMDDVAAKPINLHRLEAALRRILLRQEGAGETPRAEPSAGVDALFDDSSYQELFVDADDEGTEWLDGYLEVAVGSVARIRDNVASDDRETLKATAHRLAGTSLSAGAMRVGALARKLDRAALQATPLELQKLADEITAAFDATREDMRRFIATKAELVP
jgi:signal transduction histidine kinase/CheY-like chemotaxis protein/HPt (histidine-containing phosphotransfer) domain-containing protein